MLTRHAYKTPTDKPGKLDQKTSKFVSQDSQTRYANKTYTQDDHTRHLQRLVHKTYVQDTQTRYLERLFTRHAYKRPKQDMFTHMLTRHAYKTPTSQDRHTRYPKIKK